MIEGSVNLLQQRGFVDDKYSVDSGTVEGLLQRHGVVPFDLGKYFKLMGFKNLNELSRKYSYLKRQYSSEGLDFPVSCTFFTNNQYDSLDFSKISPSKEQPMFFLSAWVNALLTYNKDAIDFYYKNYLFDEFERAVSISERYRVNVNESELESTYIKFYDLVSYRGFTGNKGKLNHLVYKVMMPYTSKYGVREFLLNIETFREGYDNNTFTTAVKAMLVFCIRFAQNTPDTLARLLLLESLDNLIDLNIIEEVSTPREDYLCLAYPIENSFFSEFYKDGNVPANELAKFYTGGYGDFLILVGYDF